MADLSGPNPDEVGGDVAHDAADSGFPVKIGGRARTSAITAVANNDRVDAVFTAYGALNVAVVDAVGVAQATGVQYVENAALTADAAQGTLVVARRDDVPSALTPVEGDAIGLRVDGFGSLWVQSADRPFASVNLGTVIGNTQAWNTTGADTFLVRVGTSTTGTLIFEVTADDTNWQNAETWLTTTDQWASGIAQTPTSGNVYRILCAGWRQVRARTVATLGATVALVATTGADTPMLAAIDVGPAPHAIGYTLLSETAQYTSTQTGAALVTPTSGRKLVVTKVQVQAGGTTAGTFQLWFGASGDTTYTRGTDLAIFDGEFAPSATSKPGVIMDGPFLASAVDHVLRVTDSAAINPLTVTVWFYEV